MKPIFKCDCCEDTLDQMPAKVGIYQVNLDKVLGKDAKICLDCYSSLILAGKGEGENET